MQSASIFGELQGNTYRYHITCIILWYRQQMHAYTTFLNIPMYSLGETINKDFHAEHVTWRYSQKAEDKGKHNMNRTKPQ